MSALFTLFRPTLLILALSILVGCSSFEPKGSTHFDESFSKSLDPVETLLHFANCNLTAGTYMEGEMTLYSTYEGVLLITDHRVMFTQWNEAEEYYEPLIWILYPDIARIKKHNDILLRYIAIEGPEKSKNTYNLSEADVKKIYKIIMKYIANNHQKISGAPTDS